MKKIITLALLATCLMPLHAQDLETVQKAAEEARKAEARAEEARKNAEAAAKRVEEARKKAGKDAGARTGVSNSMPSEEFLRIVEEQQRMKEKAREKQEGKIGRTATDSLRWVKNQMKLHTWPRKWFVGGNLSANLCVGDNITDHPPFRYFSDAMGLGLEVYGGKYFNRKIGVRAGLGIHNVKNRMDREIVEDGWKTMKNAEGVNLYNGNGFFRFAAMELYADAMFDVTGVALTNKFYPLHVHVIMGVGMMMSGNKSLKDADTLDNLPQNEEHHYIVDGKTSQKSFEGLTDTGTHVGIAGRLGLMFDYRFSQKMSAGLELITTVTDDKFEGIKYDEPFDILIKLSGGVKYYF